MTDDAVDHLVKGFKTFRSRYFEKDKALYQQLAQGQAPRIAMIACSDSRVDPAILLQAQPGDIFMIRNVANLVPPYQESALHHGTSAALQFAVCGLGVEHIIVLGHAGCGGIKALANAAETIPGGRSNQDPSDFIGRWTSIATTAERRVTATLAGADEPTRLRACEQSAVLVSLENLTTFPWIRERLAEGTLRLHGWYFDLGAGVLSGYNPDSSSFEPME